MKVEVFMKKSFAFILFVLFFLNFSVFTESFSVQKLNEVNFSDIFESHSYKASFNDAFHINLPKDMTYVCGIEINMKIPEEIAAWRDSVSYSLYENITPKPNEKTKSYNGKKISYATLPSRLSLNVYIPLNQDFNIKDNPYSERIPVTPKLDNNDIFFKLQLVLKELPESFENLSINTTVKLVLIDKGKLNLSVEPSKQSSYPVLVKKNGSNKAKIEQKPKSKNYKVFIDDNPITSFSNLFLTTGEHHASIVSDSYRNELRTFIVEQGKTTNLSVELRGIEPTLNFICPLNTEIFFDEQNIENPKNTFIIEPGEHSVKMVVSDYEVVKTFIAQNGRSYSISLDINANVYEEY